MYVTMFTTCLDFGSWIRGKFRRDCRGLVAAMASMYFVGVIKFQAFMLRSDQRFHHVCIRLILVSWYVASMWCCHCWMFSWSDVLPMQSYSSKIWVLPLSVWPRRHNLFVSYRSIFLHEIGGMSWLTLWRCRLHSCQIFILLVEYGW